MKIYKRIAASLAAVFAALSLSFTGCAMTNGDDDGTITLTVYDQSSIFSGEMTGWFAEVLKDRLNVKLNFRTASDEGFNAYVESGTLGDIIVFNNESSYRTAKDAGLLTDWEESGLLKSHGQYIEDNYQEALDKNRLLDSEKRLYGIYGNICKGTDGHEDFYNCFYIRWDLYAKLGYPEINTLEDFEPLLADMVKLASENSDATIYGISAFGTWDNTMLDIVRSTAALYGYTDFGFGMYNPSTGAYEPCIDENGIYVRCLKFYNSLYRAGLLDPSSESQTYTIAQKDYGSGKAVMGMYKYITDPYNTTARLSNGKYMVPIAAKDFCNIADEYSPYGHNAIWSISSNCKNPELAMQLINWLYTPEGVLTNLYGPKDVTWSYDGSGAPYITEFGYSCLNNDSTVMPEGYTGAYNTGYSMFGSMCLSPDSALDESGNSYNLLTWESVKKSDWYAENTVSFDEAIHDWKEHTGANDTDEYIENNGFTILPASDFVSDELPTDLFLTNSELSGDIRTNSWLAIYAATDEEFDNVIKTMREACTSRASYSEIMKFYEDMIQKYEESVK
ncbi:MAG: extracellular solute-binding protein [Butyrivibrio sp.]|nr:extracellular solute-binding protein [Butyrivibrio sp.]